jgi:membrane protease YdiL (CAAX protease family)
MNEIHTSSEHRQRLGSLRAVDVILILATGIGLLILGSYLVGTQMELSLAASLLLYAVNVSALVGSVYALGVLRRKVSWAELGVRPAPWPWLAAAAGIALFFIPLRMMIGLGVLLLFRLPVENLQARADLLASELTWPGFLVTLLMAGGLIPFAEELFFRGVLFGWLRRRYGLWIGMATSAVIFALAHGDLAIGVSNLILGLVLAWVYDRSLSIWVPVAVHAVNNSLAVVLLYAVLVLNQFLPLAQ